MPNKPEDTDHLGKKLAKAMEYKATALGLDRLPQAAVAREFSVPPPVISQDWLPHGRIAKKHYPHLVEYFELPYEWWFGKAAVDSSWMHMLIRLYSGLSESSRYELLQQALDLYRRERPEERIQLPPRIQASSRTQEKPSHVQKKRKTARV